jgi:hypothetical protein
VFHNLVSSPLGLLENLDQGQKSEGSRQLRALLMGPAKKTVSKLPGALNCPSSSSTFGQAASSVFTTHLKLGASVWWELLILWLLLQVPLGILVGFWIKDPTDETEIPDLENVERNPVRNTLFVSSDRVSEP